jgi:hypothetical protein
MDDWKFAACRPGTYFNGGGHLRNADGGSATCQSLNGVIIMIGQYTSNFDWRSDVALFRGCAYASIPGRQWNVCLPGQDVGQPPDELAPPI